MDIESIIRRKDGTRVTLGATEYHFQPDARYSGAHVAAVEDPDHQGTFLGIPEGYRVARLSGSTTDAAAAVIPRAPARVIDPLDLPDGPAPAPVAPVEPTADATDATDANEPKAPTDGSLTADAIDAMEMDEAAALFERLEGRKPPKSIKIEALRAKLKEIALT